jgi:hypothetical protein
VPALIALADLSKGLRFPEPRYLDKIGNIQISRPSLDNHMTDRIILVIDWTLYDLVILGE